MFSQSVPEYDAPAMQGREAEEEVSDTSTVAETCREDDDKEAKEEGFHVNSARDLFFCVLA